MTEAPGKTQGKLTTHVLDTSNGVPGANIAVSLFRISGSERQALVSTKTNDDGRCDSPLLSDAQFAEGIYELEFEVGDYFVGKSGDPESDSALNAEAKESGAPRFLDRVILRFGINAADEHYHVPLLVSPFAYSTYRGS